MQRSKVYYNTVYMFNDVSLGLDILTHIVPPNRHEAPAIEKSVLSLLEFRFEVQSLLDARLTGRNMGLSSHIFSSFQLLSNFLRIAESLPIYKYIYRNLDMIPALVPSHSVPLLSIFYPTVDTTKSAAALPYSLT